ncbi:SDR family oxidoreductase [Canibacter sp. lx-45]|nr:SDR family oxidoreductase [Canibacter zhuwentaonis]
MRQDLLPETNKKEILLKNTAKPVALVTGATGGMGYEIVRDLSRSHQVIVVGRDAQKLAALAADFGAITWQQDITDYAELQTKVAALKSLDVLVNGAAIGLGYSVDNASAEHWEKYFSVNVIGHGMITSAALPLLRKSQGTIIFIGSGASTKPSPGSALYTATKHALKGLADTLRIDESAHSVRVVTVAPGPTDTKMLRESFKPEDYHPDQYIQPATIARVVRFVVDAPADTQLTDIAVRPRQEITR